MRAAEAPWKVVVPHDGVTYEDAVAAGSIPTRDGSWHDALNVLAFVRFPRAKVALHGRVLALRRARVAAATPTPGRRSREEDALTLLDECALLIGGPPGALAALADARASGSLEAIDAVVRGASLHVACFGHALLEHLALGRPPIGAGVVALPTVEASDDALDRALADAIEAGGFVTPRLSPTVPWPDPVVDAWFARPDDRRRD